MTDENFRQNESSYGSSEGMTHEPYNRLLDPNFITHREEEKPAKPVIDDLRPSENPTPVGKVETIQLETAPTPVEGPGLRPSDAPAPIGVAGNSMPIGGPAPMRPGMMPAPMMPNMGGMAPSPLMPQAPSQISMDAPVATPMPTTTREVEMAAFEEKASRMEMRASKAPEPELSSDDSIEDEFSAFEATPAQLMPQVFAPIKKEPVFQQQTMQAPATAAPAQPAFGAPLSPQTMQSQAEKPNDSKSLKKAVKEAEKQAKAEAKKEKKAAIAWQKEQAKLQKQSGTGASDIQISSADYGDGSISMKKFAILAVCFVLIGGALGAISSVVITHYKSKDIQKAAVVAAQNEVDKISESASKSQKDKDKNSKDPDDDGTSTITKGQHDPRAIETTTIDTSRLHTAAEIYAANVNATVSIVMSNSSSSMYGGASSGSGFIITNDGYIVTNYHVISTWDLYDIYVYTYNGDEYEAELVGYDDPMDIAVLKIDAIGLESVVIGDSDDVNVGDDVMAIGNPLGEYDFTMTKGIISAKEREIEVENRYMTLFQTDCAVNGGNSGGAMFNMYGEVIGIVNAKHAAFDFTEIVDGIAFAIPMNDVFDIITDIISKDYISSPYIGVECMAVTVDMQKEGKPEGVYLQTIMDNTPAEEAGLEDGDIITKINGIKVSTTQDLKGFIKDAGVGGELELTIDRDGKELTITVEVGEQTKPAING